MLVLFKLFLPNTTIEQKTNSNQQKHHLFWGSVCLSPTVANK